MALGPIEFKKTVIVIPALNPDFTLYSLLLSLSNHETFLETFEVLLVDDGSTTKTAEQVFEISVALAGVKRIRHDSNLGKGEAIKTGLRYAIESKAASVITADADGQHLPEDIIAVSRHSVSNDEFVIGVRNFPAVFHCVAKEATLLVLLCFDLCKAYIFQTPSLACVHFHDVISKDF